MRLLLAVSGGIDSMYLANRAGELYPDAEFGVAHCNFSLRGEESDRDCGSVRDWASSHGVPFHTVRFDTTAYASSHGVSVEMAARELRYGWFRDVCAEYGYEAVVVAHNADDNAETLILNIVRGCGIRGLRGMGADSTMTLPDGRTLRILRPMLNVSRAQITQWMTSHGMTWREDSTNAADGCRRNVIRHQVMPALKSLNPSLLRTLSEDMRRWSQAGDALDASFMEFKSRFPGDCVPVRELLAQSDWEYKLWRLTEGIVNADQYKGLVQALKSGGTLAGKRFGRVVTGSGVIVLDAPQEYQDDGEIVIDGPGEYRFAESTLRMEIHHRQPGDSLKAPSGVLYAAKRFPFVLRLRRDGDWMRPFGMGGCRRKLSDILTDLKMPVTERQRTLVLADPADKKHALAILGKRIDESLAVGGDDESYLTLTL